MAWEEQLAVRDSNLYENKGLAKPLLTLIGQLVIGPDEKDPHPDEGFCIATQDYLAAALGCSTSEVMVWVKIFEEDGVITKVQYRTKQGWKRNKYAVNMEVVVANRMEKDERGDFIRNKNPQMKRATSQFASRTTSQIASEPDGKLRVGLVADCEVSYSQIACREVDLASSGAGAGASGCPANTKDKDSGRPRTPKTEHDHSKAVKPHLNGNHQPRSASYETPTVPSGSPKKIARAVVAAGVGDGVLIKNISVDEL